MSVAFLNGSFGRLEELAISLLDRGFLFGEGVFTTMRLKEGLVENISRHLSRLEEHCRALRIIPPLVEKEAIRELAARNQAEAGTWRLKAIVTRGAGENFGLRAKAQGAFALTLEHSRPVPKSPYRLGVYPFPVSRPTAHLKSLGYLDRQAIKQFAEERGCQEALTFGADGSILEGAFSNIFWIVGNTLFTPSFSLPLLKGTYLSSVIEGALKMGFQIAETKSRLEEMEPCAKIFVCNSMIGLKSVASIDSSEFGLDPELESSLMHAAQEVIASDVLDVRVQVNSFR